MYAYVYMLIKCLASVTAYSSKVIMIYRYSVVDRRGVGKKLYAKTTKVHGLYEA